MARLNEPPVSAESLEMLRRKFLRQNRDIARVNSTQSLRIRSLENECARLLSENLDLRGQILRLEKAAENSPASRIADHALEIKSKMELQLLELGSLLDSLGLEPPMKRRAPSREERRIAKPRTILGHSPRQRKPKELDIEEQEALAAQEGRLPPIHEHKSYPRQTLNRQEILALCSEADPEAETSTDSPVLGPPPVSKYVEDEPEKVDSPSSARRLLVYSDICITDETHLAAPKIDPAETTPVPSPSKKSPRSPEPKVDAPQSPEKLASTLVQPEARVTKCGSKRKHAVADENEMASSFTKASETNSRSNSGTEKPTSATRREIKNRRNARGLPGARKDARDQKYIAVVPAPARPALAAKSTNEDITSPRKAAANGIDVDGDKSNRKPTTLKEVNIKAAPLQTQVEEAIPILPKSPPPPQVINLHPSELAVSGAAVQLLSPGTPARFVPGEISCDTPPPPDISSRGDTARPSRKARAAVSYAEPNLRDKMRRPTKELIDAVSGEGKYKQRASISHDAVPAPRSVANEKAGAGTPRSSTTTVKVVQQPVSKDSGRESGTMTPTSKKGPSREGAQEAAAVNITGRRKRTSTMDEKDSASTKAEGPTAPASRTTTRDNTTKTKETRKIASSLDPYEFISASPASQTVAIVERSSTMRASQPKTSRRQLPPVLLDDGEGTTDAATKAAPRTNPSRKRASLAVTSRRVDDKVDTDDEYVAEATEVDSNASRDRISRRRSMML